MNNMNKTVIIPIVAVLALVAKLVYGIEVNQITQDQVSELVTAIVLGITGLIGVVKNYKKESDSNQDDAGKQ